MSRFIVLLFLAMLLSPARGAEGHSCVLLGKTGTRVLVQGALATLPLRLSDCADVTALAAGVSMCYVGAEGRRTCKDLAPNVSVNSSSFASAAAASIGLAPTVVLLLRGDVQTRPGMTRASGPMQGFPTGTVYPDGPELLFPTNEDPRLASATELELKLAGTQATPLRALRIDGGFTVPAMSLLPGAAYVWTVQASGGPLTGRFTVHAGDTPALAEGLRAIDTDSALSPAARSYLKAELFEEHALKYNRDREVARVRGALENR